MRTDCNTCGAPLDGSSPTYCKACVTAKAKRRYAANPENAKAAAKKYADANRELVNQRQREGRAADPEKWAVYHVKWRASNSESRKATRRKSNLQNYGLTPAQFDEMYDDQCGQCLICSIQMQKSGREKNSACVDHDHESGIVRGLLCNKCNRAIGLLNEDPAALASAYVYLAAWKGVLEASSEELDTIKEM